MRYELQSFDGKRWVIETLHDEKTIAVADARSMMSGNRPPEAVRVIENGASGESKTVFQKKRNQPEFLHEIRRKKEKEEELNAAIAERKARRKRHAAWEAAQERRQRLRLLLISSLIAAACICMAAVFLPQLY